MRRETAEALNRLNERFYERSAEAFRATRARPWPGWERLLAAWREGPLARLIRCIRDAGVPSNN